MTEAKEIIEVLGIKYEERPQKKSPGMSSTMMRTMLMLAPYMMMGTTNRGRRDSTGSAPQVDIVEEFKLIQDKKSKLSRSQREWVVDQFHKNFIIVNPQPNE